MSSKITEAKPPLVNQQCAVYEYKYDLCDGVGYTRRHLFQRIGEHNIRQLANTCVAHTIKRIKIYVTNLPSWTNAVESWIAQFTNAFYQRKET